MKGKCEFLIPRQSFFNEVKPFDEKVCFTTLPFKRNNALPSPVRRQYVPLL